MKISSFSPEPAHHSTAHLSPYRASDKRTFFDDAALPRQRYGSGDRVDTTNRFQGTQAYLSNHPGIKGQTQKALSEWPVYQTYQRGGRRHMADNPTFTSHAPLVDVGVPEPVGCHAPFKSGWKSMRHEVDIKPYEAREAARHNKEAAGEAISQKRRERLAEWNNYNGFNPLKQEDLVPASQESAMQPRTRGAGTWAPSVDTSWFRQAVTARKHVQPAPHDPSPERMKQMQDTHTARAENLRREGRDRYRPNAQPTMYDIMHWA